MTGVQQLQRLDIRPAQEEVEAVEIEMVEQHRAVARDAHAQGADRAALA